MFLTVESLTMSKDRESQKAEYFRQTHSLSLDNEKQSLSVWFAVIDLLFITKRLRNAILVCNLRLFLAYFL